MGWLIFVGYLLMMLVTLRVGFVIAMDSNNHRRESFCGEEILVIFAGLLWPLTIPALVVWGAWKAVTYPTKVERARILEDQARQKERDDRNRQREYERNAAIVGVPPVLSRDTTAPDTPLLEVHPYQGW